MIDIDVIITLVRAVAKATNAAAMDDMQLKILNGYIRRTIERRGKVRQGKEMEAQEKDDAELKAALTPEWMDLI